MERMDSLPEARRKKVEERAKVLIAEEISLRDLRKARTPTQARVAKELGINQEKELDEGKPEELFTGA